MRMTASRLRAETYRVLDYALATGDVVEIEHRGRTLRLTAVKIPSRLDSLVRRHDVIGGNADDLVTVDWTTSSN